MKNNIYGYMCITSIDYEQAKQLEELEMYCVAESSIFIDYLGGKHTTRDKYMKLKSKLKKDDFLLVKSLDQLGQNHDEVMKELNYITCIIKAYVVVIGTNDDQFCTIISID